MKRSLIALVVLVAGVGVAGTALAVAGGGDRLNPAAVEPKTTAVDELVDDPEAGKPDTYAPKGPEDKPPTYEPGSAKVVSPDSEIGRRINPDQDPTIRICEGVDGRITIMHTDPAPGKDPYPNDPESLRSRPC